MDFKKLLIAIDGSENSLRAVSYVGEMLGSAPGYHVELLYVERFPARDLFPDDVTWRAHCEELLAEMHRFLDDARDTLVAKGFPQDQVSINYVPSCKSPFPDRSVSRCSPGTSVAREILGVLKEGGFGTLVLGRRGVSKAEEFLFGSVTNKVIQALVPHLEKGDTVWVVS